MTRTEPEATRQGFTSLLRRQWGPHVAASVLGPLSAVVLTRILAPQEYGLLGAAGAIVAIASRVSELRFAESLVPRKDVTPRLLDTAFWVSVASTAIVALAVGTLAGPLSRAMGVEQAAPLLLPAALPLVIDAAASVFAAQLRRDMRVAALGWLEVTATLATTVVAIGLARIGLGAWSIVIGQIVGRTLRLALLAATRVHRVRLQLDRAEIVPQLRFGLPLLAASVVGSIAGNADRAVLARAFDVAALGYYDRAMALSSVPALVLAGPFGALFFPYFSRELREGRSPSGPMREFMRLFAVLAIPGALVLGIAVVLLVPLVLGERWAPVGPIAALAIPQALAMVPGSVAYQVYTATGRTGLWLRYGLAKSAIVLPVTLWAARYGPAAAALAQSAISCTFVLGNVWIASRLLGAGRPAAFRLWHVASPAMVAAAAWVFWDAGGERAAVAPAVIAATLLAHAVVVRLSDRDALSTALSRARAVLGA